MHATLGSILLTGSYGCDNFGDDALVVAAYEIIKRAGFEDRAVLAYHNATYLNSLLPRVNIAPINRNLAEEDIVVYCGGTRFYSFPLSHHKGAPHIFKWLISRLCNPARLGGAIYRRMVKHCEPTRRRRVAAMGLGVGPFHVNNGYVEKTKRLLTQMEYLAVRDISSYNLCKEWGCQNVKLGADLCYLPDLWQLPKNDSVNVPAINRIKRIGVIVRDWPHTVEGGAYGTSLIHVVGMLRNDGYEVVFISFAPSRDREWCNRLAGLNEPVCVWNPMLTTIGAFLETLSGFDAFITARYHGAVFASILHKPVICIDVEQKLSLVSELLEGGSRLWSHPFAVNACLEQINDISLSYSHAVTCLREVVGKQNSLAALLINELKAVLEGNCTRAKFPE